MDYTIVEFEEQTVMGVTTRTSNEAADCGEKIGGLWGQMMGQGKAQTIPEPKLTPYVSYGLYYNYDFTTMEYDVMVGCASMGSEAPSGMEKVVIPAGKYAKFSIVGDVVKSVGNAWNEIWEMDLDRAFTVDFEAYLPGEDMQNAGIDIYIALK